MEASTRSIQTERLFMIHRITRIGPWQLGMVTGFLYALISLVSGLIFLVFGMSTVFLPTGNVRTSELFQPFGMGCFLLLLMPIVYGAVGFVTGVIGAVAYNIASRWVGGIQIEVE